MPQQLHREDLILQIQGGGVLCPSFEQGMCWDTINGWGREGKPNTAGQKGKMY